MNTETVLTETIEAKATLMEAAMEIGSDLRHIFQVRTRKTLSRKCRDMALDVAAVQLWDDVTWLRAWLFDRGARVPRAGWGGCEFHWHGTFVRLTPVCTWSSPVKCTDGRSRPLIIRAYPQFALKPAYKQPEGNLPWVSWVFVGGTDLAPSVCLRSEHRSGLCEHLGMVPVTYRNPKGVTVQAWTFPNGVRPST